MRMRWEILKHLAKFTYDLETDEVDGMGWSVRDLKTFGQVHVLPGDGWRGWNGMMRWEILKHWPSSRTAWRWMKRMGWDDQWEILKHLAKFTYFLDTDEEDGMGWSVRDLKTFGQVHVLAGYGWRGWDGMMRWEILNQFTKVTYELETDDDDEMRDLKTLAKFTYFLETNEESDERSWNIWPSSRTIWRRMKRMGWDDQWEILKHLAKFTYLLETDEEDGMGWSDGIS